MDSAWFAERGSPTSEPSTPEGRAAWLAAQHASTPTTVHLDTLGRPFLSIAHNRTGSGSSAVEAFYETRTELDIEGNTLSITDARGNKTIEQRFDVLARRLRVDSPDAGARLAIADVAGKPLRGWDSRGQSTRAAYDALQRPTHSYVRSGAKETLVGCVVHGEALDSSGPATNPATPSPAQALNLRGKPYLVFDSAGRVKSEHHDFKGNPLRASRKLATTYQTTPSWNALAAIADPASIESTAASLLEAEVFTTETKFDALNRVVEATSPTSATSPAPSVTRPAYNEANLLDSVHVAVRGAAEQTVVSNLEYNSKGQRTLCEHANPTTGAVSHRIEYTYDEKTFRLTRLKTTRTSDSVVLQDLRYTFDAVGNITECQDHGAAPLFSGTAPVSGDGKYQYDALYRLTYAEGREHPGQQQPTQNDLAPGSVPHANDLQALVRYDEDYVYDAVGNIQRVVHHVGSGGWTRRYDYATTSNRLLGTSLPGDPDGTFSVAYSYDAHGSMVTMPPLSSIGWDYADRMQHANKGGGGDVYFTYDAGGQRVRKVYEHSGVVEERIYLGGYEIYRKRSGTVTGTLELERETLHVMDDQRRVAIVETKLVDIASVGPAPLSAARWRFQLENHLGSASMELDTAAGILSYEEYHPYGSTAFRTAKAGAEVSAKRYRYTGKERDEETGLYYHGARYYAPWLGRWTAADPLGLAEPGRPDLALYAYVSGNPPNRTDPSGFDERDEVAAQEGKAAGEAAARASAIASAQGNARAAGQALLDARASAEPERPDGYATAAEAAFAALALYNPTSVRTRGIMDRKGHSFGDPEYLADDDFGLEYGGLIYELGGRYYFTPTATPDSAGVEVWDALSFVPADAKNRIVGDYHTHGAPPTKRQLQAFGDGEDFSGYRTDKDWMNLVLQAEKEGLPRDEWPKISPEVFRKSDIGGGRADLEPHQKVGESEWGHRENILDPNTFTSFLATPKGRFTIHVPASGVVFSFSPNERLLPKGRRILPAGYAK